MRLAGCIIQDEQGKVLLLHRSTAKRVQWETPGGKVDPGESAEQAAVRELAEELGVTVKIVRHLGSKIFEEDGERHEYDWFAAEVVQGRPRLAEPQTFDRLGYFDTSEMLAMSGDLSPNTKNFVLALKSGKITL